MKDRVTSLTVDLREVRVADPFWSEKMETVRQKMLPYQWDALNDRIPGAEPSHCMENFRIAAGLEEGEFQGRVFQDSDLAKWIEAVGYSLISHPDPELERTADEAIDLVVSAQQPDGYLDTYYIITGLEKRFTNLMSNHELYCAGHLIEGAIAYYQGTGKDKLLRAALRLADCIDKNFGPEPEKCKGYPGHQVLEMALVRLYKLVGEERYLRLAQFFVEQRGRSPLYFEEECKKYSNEFYWENSPYRYQYYQAGRPIREQRDAEGHAVRAVYYYSGAADLARETGDESLFAACRELWESITKRRMYLTGGIGSTSYGEAFTYDYDLPSDTVYAETCASVGLVFFAHRMLQCDLNREYADIMERELFNGALSGMSVDATSFFYVNPLEVVPEACEKDHLRSRVKPQRQKWFACACCPPNLARLVESVGAYAATRGEGAFYLHLYLGGTYETGCGARLEVQSGFPWSGKAALTVRAETPTPFRLGLRVPGWCTDYTVKAAGETVRAEPQASGYVFLDRTWRDGDRVELEFQMPVRLLRGNPRVRETFGKAALMRGPLVYCLEEADNGKDLYRLEVKDASGFTCVEREGLGGYVALRGPGAELQSDAWDDGELYAGGRALARRERELEFLPYYLWANRGLGEMTVWVRDGSC